MVSTQPFDLCDLYKLKSTWVSTYIFIYNLYKHVLMAIGDILQQSYNVVLLIRGISFGLV